MALLNNTTSFGVADGLCTNITSQILLLDATHGTDSSCPSWIARDPCRDSRPSYESVPERPFSRWEVIHREKTNRMLSEPEPNLLTELPAPGFGCLRYSAEASRAVGIKPDSTISLQRRIDPLHKRSASILVLAKPGETKSWILRYMINIERYSRHHDADK
jgi:hypothetical protein